MTRLERILDRLTRLHPKVIDLSLGRIEHLLAALGNPEARLAPVIHVAGTNGKGSTIAHLRAFLEAAGYRAHVYTSPHLVHFNERIRLAGRLIEEDALAALLEECEAVNEGHPITFFEVTTAAAFTAFARTPADVVILETGLGGRLDATNVLARPAITVITPLAMDHMNFLGDSLGAIAAEKAGIMRPGVATLCAAQAPEAERVVADRAAALGAPLILEGRDWQVERTGGLRYQGHRGWQLDLPCSALPGRHQDGNAGLALAAAEALTGFHFPPSALAQGMTQVEWPARLQRLHRGPLVNGLPPGWELWLDGGHNPAAGRVIAEALAEWHLRPIDLVFGLLESKDAAGFLRPLAPFARHARGVAIPGHDTSRPAADVAALAVAAGMEARPAESVWEAVASLTAGGSAPGRILICGSLYLAGSVLADHG